MGKLNKRELAVRTFIIKVFKKEITITSAVFRKVVAIFADRRNESIVEKYGNRIYASMLSTYKFKNHKDYTTKLDLLKQTAYLNTGLTQYGLNHTIITKKLFDSASVKTEWIIEDMANAGSMAEINYVVSHIFRREKENLSKILDELLQITQYTKNEKTVASAVIRNIVYSRSFSDVEFFQSILDREMDKPSDDVVRSLEVYFKDANASKSIVNALQNWLYEKTNKEEYLSDTAKDIFIF